MALTTNEEASTTPATHDGIFEKQSSGGDHDKPREVEGSHTPEGAEETGSTHKQEGVRQVEGIIAVWSKQVLIVMFIL